MSLPVDDLSIIPAQPNSRKRIYHYDTPELLDVLTMKISEKTGDKLVTTKDGKEYIIFLNPSTFGPRYVELDKARPNF